MTAIPPVPTNKLASLFSFSREDSSILKGYGILFMIFHHCFGLYALPETTDTNWVSPIIIRCAANLKICVVIFIFITGYAMSLKLSPHPSLATYLKSGMRHYFKFWKIYLLCLFLVIFISWAFPTQGLPSPDKLDWRQWLASFSGIHAYYADWWYMGLFAFGSIVLYPVSSFIENKKTPVISLFLLLGCSLLLQLILQFLPQDIFYGGIIRWAPLFMLGYMFALAAKHLGEMSVKKCTLVSVILLLEILSIHLFCFSLTKKWMPLFLVSIWLLPWLTRKLHLTGVLMLLGSYSALMWLNHRFIFGYHFSEVLYGSHSYVLVYGITVAGSLLLAMGMQRSFHEIYRLLSVLWRKIGKGEPAGENL